MIYFLYKVTSYSIPIVYLVLGCILILAFCDLSQIFVGLQYDSLSIYGETFRQVKNKRVTIFVFIIIYIICVFIITFSNRSIIHFLGCTDVRTLDYGEYAYAVSATSGNNKEQEYLAKIDVDILEEDNDETTQIITVDRIYLDNGKRLDFEDSDFFDYPSKYPTLYIVNTDQNGKDWKIKLTNKKLHTTLFDDWSLYDTKEIIWFIVGFVILSFVMVINLYYYAKYQILEKLKSKDRRYYG